MRLPRTLFRYLAREILLYGALAFIVISVVLVSHNLLRRLDELMMVGFTAEDFGTVLRCLMPMLAAYTVPLAFLIGTLVAIRRLVNDGELLAIRSCGVGLSAVLAPTLTVALLTACYSGYTLTSVEHRARRELLTLFKTVAARGGMFEAGRFANLSVGVFFVESRDRHGVLRGVMIADNSNPNRRYRIFAETGTFEFDEEADAISLLLTEGELHIEPNEANRQRYQRVHFDEFTYLVDVRSHMKGANTAVRPKQMSLSELREVIARADGGDELRDLDEKDPVEYRLEIHRRYAMPVAPLLFGMIAVPLGMAGSRSGNVLGLLLCGLLVFAYYAVLSLTQLLAREAWLSPVLALWLPNALFFAAGCLLILRVGRGTPR